MRVEYRIHNMTAGAGPTAIGPFKVVVGGGTLGITTNILNAPHVDSLGATNPNGQPACCGAFTDVKIRVQRDIVNSTWRLTLCATQNASQCSTVANPITSLGTDTDWTDYLFAPGSGYRIAYMRWFSTVVDTSTPISIAGVTGDVADWEFEGSMSDSVHGLAFTGVGSTVAYTTTPVYNPSCDAGTQQTFKVGVAGTVSGANSVPLDGGTTLTYLWAYAGTGADGKTQSTIAFGTPTGATTTVTGLARGSVNLNLTVTDGTAHSSLCTIHNGAVVVNANDIVTTGLGAKQDRLLGKLIRYGSTNNITPWIDVTNKQLADLQGEAMPTNFPIYWNTFSPGTVAVSPTMACGGSMVGYGLVGTGTTFSEFSPGDYIAIAWNGGSNRDLNIVDSVVSNTCVILHYPWNRSANLTGPISTETGLNFVHPDPNTVNVSGFDSAASPGGYYDGGKGFRSFYERSGIDTYWTYWVYLADYYWLHPARDQGLAYNQNYQAPLSFNVPRNQNVESLVLRAGDSGMSGMWTGLRLLNTYNISFLDRTSMLGWQTQDTRETGYLMEFIANHALTDTDATAIAASKTSLSTAMASSLFTGGAIHADGSIPSLGLTIVNTTQPVTVVQGSTTVLCPTCNFTGMFPASAPFFVTYDGYPTVPPSNTQFRSSVYLPVVFNATTLTLDRPYVEASGTVGWATGGDSGAVSNRYVPGWGCQAFMCGILTKGLTRTAEAIAVSDPAGSAAATAAAVGLASWIRTKAYANPAFGGVGGVYYYTDYLPCNYPIQTAYCTTDYDANQSRADAGEVVQGLTQVYLSTSDANLAAFNTTLVSEMFCKVGYGAGTTCVSDGFYLDGLDTGGSFMSNTYQASKWWGFFFGWCAIINWLAEVADMPAPSPVTGTLSIEGNVRLEGVSLQ